MQFRLSSLVILAFLTLSSAVAQILPLPSRSSSDVRVIQAPQGSLVPDVCLDAQGVLHMVYAKNDNAWYARSTDNGATFDVAVKVNGSSLVASTMGERGPKIAVGTDGVIHVVWMDKWSASVHVFARYSRSTDGGRSFSAPVSVSATDGIDGLTLAVDGKQHVAVFWHTLLPAASPVAQGTWLHRTVSSDNGATFGADTNVAILNHTGLACSMCMTRARFARDGIVSLLFRSAQDSVRDFYLIRGNVFENSYTAIRVNRDNWKIGYCPMVGPELTITPNGRHLAAFMTSNRVYWSLSDSACSRFDLHVATPANENNELYPSAVANTVGDVLFLWQVGPMSVSGTAVVKWALYSSDGLFSNRQGTIGTSLSGTKATSFVGTDGRFYIVTNADLPSGTDASPTAAEASLYPNPTHDILSVRTSYGSAGTVSWRIISPLGKTLRSGNRLRSAGFDDFSINVRDLTPGRFFLNISSDSRFSFIPFIKR